MQFTDRIVGGGGETLLGERVVSAMVAAAASNVLRWRALSLESSASAQRASSREPEISAFSTSSFTSTLMVASCSQEA